VIKQIYLQGDCPGNTQEEYQKDTQEVWLSATQAGRGYSDGIEAGEVVD
jgi:hypothetical protein